MTRHSQKHLLALIVAMLVIWTYDRVLPAWAAQLLVSAMFGWGVGDFTINVFGLLPYFKRKT